MHNKYHRRRILRKLLASFRPPADDGHERESEDGSVADLPQLPSLPPVAHGLQLGHLSQVNVAEEAEVRATQARNPVLETLTGPSTDNGKGSASVSDNSGEQSSPQAENAEPEHQEAAGMEEEETTPAEEEVMEEEEEDEPAQAAPPPPSLPSQASSVGTPPPSSASAVQFTGEEISGDDRPLARNCCLCEEEEVATNSCDQCGPICAECSTSHIRSPKP